MKRTALVLFAVVLLAGLVAAQPGGAVIPATGGQVNGTVKLSAAANVTDGCAVDPTSAGYDFVDVFLNGTFTDGSTLWVGQTTTANTYGRTQVCYLSPVPDPDPDPESPIPNPPGGTSSGNVSWPAGFSDSSGAGQATFTGSSIEGVPITGTYYGTYYVNASLVRVYLKLWFKIGSTDPELCINTPDSCVYHPIEVRAQLTPLVNPDGTYTEIALAGNWNSDTPSPEGPLG